MKQFLLLYLLLCPYLIISSNTETIEWCTARHKTLISNILKSDDSIKSLKKYNISVRDIIYHFSPQEINRLCEESSNLGKELLNQAKMILKITKEKPQNYKDISPLKREESTNLDD